MKILTILFLTLFISFDAERINPLAGTSWRLFAISDSEKGKTYNFYRLQSTLFFSDSTLEISGCNAMSGTYKFHSDNRLTMHGIKTTDLFCEAFTTVEEYIATSFFDLTFKTHNDTLDLHSPKGLNFKYLRDK